MASYAIVEDNKVYGVLSTAIAPGDGKNCVEVPDDCPIGAGMDVREFDKEWKLRPLEERVAAGLVKLDPHLKVEGDTIIPKTPVECILDGVEELPAGYKLVPEDKVPAGTEVSRGYALMQMTHVDLVLAGKVSLNPGVKLIRDPSVPEGYAFGAMTDEELVAAGILTEREGKIQALKNELQELDSVISRELEDFYREEGIEPKYPKRYDAMKRKAAIREQLADLAKAEAI